MALFYESCIASSRNICASTGEKNCSEKSLQCSDEKIKTILNQVSFTKSGSTCRRSVEKTLCIKTVYPRPSCINTSHEGDVASQLANDTNACGTCFEIYHMANNISQQEEIKNWLKSCISNLLEKRNETTSGKQCMCKLRQLIFFQVSCDSYSDVCN